MVKTCLLLSNSRVVWQWQHYLSYHSQPGNQLSALAKEPESCQKKRRFMHFTYRNAFVTVHMNLYGDFLI